MSRTGLLTTDASLIIRSWDPHLEAMTGIPAGEAVGRPLAEICPEAEERGILSLLGETLKTGAVTVLAPAIHHFLIACDPLEASTGFDRMQQRVIATSLTNDFATAGLAISVEDVTARLAVERRLARELTSADPAARRMAVEELRSLGEESVGPLGVAMGDEDWQVRRAVVEAMASRSHPELLDSIVRALRDGHHDFSLLSSAIKLLALTELDATRALIDLLHADDVDLRIQAALALGMQTSPEAIPALLGALEDQDRNVRFHAIESLGKCRAREAVEPLATIAEHEDFFLAFPAIDALVRIGEPSVAPRIASRLADPSVRDAAAEALGALGDEDAVAPLVSRLEEHGAPVGAIVRALSAIHARYEETAAAAGRIEDLVRRTVTPVAAAAILAFIPLAASADLRAALLVLSWTCLPTVTTELTRLLGQAAVPHEVIETLVRFGSPILDVLIAQLRGGSTDTRRAAAVALGRLGDRAAVPALVETLEEADTHLLAPVCGALARLGDERAFEPLFAHMGHPDPGVRQAVVGALNSIGHPGMAARIADALNDTNPYVRQSAAKIAGYFGYPAIVGALLACGSDPDERVRAAALEHMAYVEDPRVQSMLVHAMRTDTPRCRAAAAAALGHIEDSAVATALRQALDDPDPWVRYFAASSLGRCRDEGALDDLAARAKGDPAGQVRIAAIDAIGAVGGLKAVELLEPLTQSRDADIAAAAMRAAGHVRVPAAAAVLRAGLRSETPVVRAAAAEALGTHGGTDVLEALQWTASAVAHPSVISAALSALTTLASRADTSCDAVRAIASVASDPSRRSEALPVLARIPHTAVPALGAVLQSPEISIRLVAIDALGRIGRSPASSLLMEAVADAEPLVRVKAIEALARLGARSAARRLAEVARNDESEDVRRVAEVALARAGGADAQQWP
jgi:HEAT repeat protein